VVGRACGGFAPYEDVCVSGRLVSLSVLWIRLASQTKVASATIGALPHVPIDSEDGGGTQLLKDSLSVWVVLVNFNGTEDTRKCLASLRRVPLPIEVVVVDNASEPDPTSDLRAEFSWARVVRNPVNEGWSGGNNTGIRIALEAGADFVLLLNNDTVVSPKIVDRLLAAFRGNAAFAVIGPIIRFMDEPHNVMTDAVAFNPKGYPGFFRRREVEEQPDGLLSVAETDVVNGCCMMIRADAFERVGLIDDRYFLIHEEADFCLRAKSVGLNCGVLAESLVWHKGSASFKRTGRHWQRYYDSRNLLFLLRDHWRMSGRGLVSTMKAYLRYVYHRYCIEREACALASANAVIEGLIDGIMSRPGTYRSRVRWGVPLVRNVFETARRLTGAR
jgi:GT2 family glycosyltransferase